MLRRIELRDRCGDWRGLFRAIPQVPVEHIIADAAVREAPWDEVDLKRQPRFFFTEYAWEQFAKGVYERLREILGNDVRLTEICEAHADAKVVDDIQAIVYTA